MEATFGLWRYCISVLSVKKCQDISSHPENFDSGSYSRIQAAVGLITAACVLSGISTFCLLACAILGDNAHKILLLIMKLLVFASFILGTIGVALGIYTVVKNPLADQSYISITISLGAAALLGIAACIINLIGAIIALFIRK